MEYIKVRSREGEEKDDIVVYDDEGCGVGVSHSYWFGRRAGSRRGSEEARIVGKRLAWRKDDEEGAGVYIFFTCPSASGDSGWRARGATPPQRRTSMFRVFFFFSVFSFGIFCSCMCV